MFTANLAIQSLVHVAAIFTLVCFLFRDQIKLRIFAAMGDILLSAYYCLAFPEPLWNPLVWSVMNVVINTTMILIILQDGRVLQMSDDEMTLFRNLPSLSPGQFRKLMKKAEWHRTEDRQTLTSEAEDLHDLYYVLEGPVTITKAGRDTVVDPRIFIGEIALLRDSPASASVSVGAGSVYVKWRQHDLKSMFKANEDFRTAFSNLLNSDMAGKVARA